MDPTDEQQRPLRSQRTASAIAPGCGSTIVTPAPQHPDGGHRRAEDANATMLITHQFNEMALNSTPTPTGASRGRRRAQLTTARTTEELLHGVADGTACDMLAADQAPALATGEASCTATAGGLGPAVPWAASYGTALSVCLAGDVTAAVGTPITDARQSIGDVISTGSPTITIANAGGDLRIECGRHPASGLPQTPQTPQINRTYPKPE